MITISIAGLLALLLSALSLRLLLQVAPQTKLMDYPGDRRRIHREAVPRIGGLAIFSGILASLVAVPLLTRAEQYGLSGAALLVLVGALDDRYHLGARLRLVAQIGAGLLLTLGGGVVITDLGDLLGGGPLLLGTWAVPFTVLAIVGLINAFNMVDGIDGLAGGLTMIALGSLLFFLPMGSGTYLLLISTLAALVPYLICNLELCRCPCKVFLGDAGSMLLGYLIVWGLIEASRSPGGIMPITAIWLTAVPLMDTLAVIMRRLKNGRHPFNADRGHLHHLLARHFHSTPNALILLLLLATLSAGMGIMGLALGIAEAHMLYLAMGIFALYLWTLGKVPKIYRRRLSNRPKKVKSASSSIVNSDRSSLLTDCQKVRS